MLSQLLDRITLTDWLLLVVALLLGLYLWGTWNYDYFTGRGVPFLRPSMPFLGHMGPAFFGIKAFPDTVKELYDRGAGEPVVGIFEFMNPQFMIRDPELLKIISVKEFDHFMNHRTTFDETFDPMFTKNLFALRGQRWRDMRATLSPAFTSSKLKGMFDLISTCGRQLADHIAEKYKNAGKDCPLEMNVKDLFTRFTNDVIATTAFGVHCNSLQQPDNEFYVKGRSIATFRMLAVAGYLMVPWLMARLGVKMIDPDAQTFFGTLVHETIQERQKRGIHRQDMLQLLMQARDGNLKAEEGEEEEEENASSKNKGNKLKLTEVDITAQALIFFVGGFDTVSTAMCYSAYALAAHAHVQERLRDEVDDLMQRTSGQPTYDDVTTLKYLDMVVSESLRLYPPAGVTDRQCVAPYVLQLPGDRAPLHFRERDLLSVPVHGIHRDPQYWEDPEKFNPERFSEENKRNIKPFTYMPFGLGPRVCIGQRLALLELKVALVHLVARFEVLPAASTPVPIVYSRQGGFAPTPQGGFLFAFRPRAR